MVTAIRWATLAAVIVVGLVGASRGHGSEQHTSTSKTTAPLTPTSLASHEGYKLQGCFSQPGVGAAGVVLGDDFIMPTNASMASKMTVPFCIGACLAVKTEEGNAYEFVAIGKGEYVHRYQPVLSMADG